MEVGRWIFYSVVLVISLDIFCSNKDYLTLECGRTDPLNCQTVSLWSFHGTQLNPYGFTWLRLQPSRRPRGKRYLSARAPLYPNHDASFSLTRVARSGDVAINPGPDPASTATSESLKLTKVRAKCCLCERVISKNTKRILECSECSQQARWKCAGLTKQMYAQAGRWNC